MLPHRSDNKPPTAYYYTCTAYKSPFVYSRASAIHGIYRYDTVKLDSWEKTGCQTKYPNPWCTYLHYSKGNTWRCCLSAFCKRRRWLPAAKHVSTSQARVCVYILQLYAQDFSALSGFTQRLLTPSAFVPDQCITKKEFPQTVPPLARACLYSADCLPPLSIISWLTSVNNCSVIAVNKSLPLFT